MVFRGSLIRSSIWSDSRYSDMISPEEVALSLIPILDNVEWFIKSGNKEAALKNLRHLRESLLWLKQQDTIGS